MSELTRTELEIDGESWFVELRGDSLQIVDPIGRQRHVSHGHENTGLLFAMLIARQPFHTVEAADEAMRLAAERFRSQP